MRPGRYTILAQPGLNAAGGHDRRLAGEQVPGIVWYVTAVEAVAVERTDSGRRPKGTLRQRCPGHEPSRRRALSPGTPLCH